jgi:hypothetical protein
VANVRPHSGDTTGSVAAHFRANYGRMIRFFVRFTEKEKTDGPAGRLSVQDERRRQ